MIELELIDRGLEGAEAWVENIQLGLRRGLSDPALRRAADTAGDVIVDSIEREANRRFKRPTGRLVRSFEVKVLRGGRSLFNTRVFSRLPYAAAQDRGATILPVTARALTVPLRPQARTRRARDIEGLHRRGRALFLGNTPLYALAQSTRLPPTFYLTEAIRRARPKLVETLRVGIRKMVRTARRRG